MVAISVGSFKSPSGQFLEYNICPIGLVPRLLAREQKINCKGRKAGRVLGTRLMSNHLNTTYVLIIVRLMNMLRE